MTVLDNVKVGLHYSQNYSLLASILHLPNYFKGEEQMTKKAKRNMLVTLGIIFTIGIIFSPVFAKVIILIVAAGHFYYFLCRIKTVEEQENIYNECE